MTTLVSPRFVQRICCVSVFTCVVAATLDWTVSSPSLIGFNTSVWAGNKAARRTRLSLPAAPISSGSATGAIGTSNPQVPASKQSTKANSDVDFRSLAKLRPFETIREEQAVIAYVSEADVAQAFQFSLETLTAEGWSEKPELGRKNVNSNFGNCALQKGNDWATLAVINSLIKPGKTEVLIRNLGLNVDLLPTVPGAKVYHDLTCANLPALKGIDEVRGIDLKSLGSSAKASFLLKFISRELVADQWRQMRAAPDTDTGGNRPFPISGNYFKRNGVTLDLTIFEGMAITPETPFPNRAVFRIAAPLQGCLDARRLPFPAEATEIHYEPEREITYFSKASTETLTEFYRQAFKDWKFELHEGEPGDAYLKLANEWQQIQIDITKWKANDAEIRIHGGALVWRSTDPVLPVTFGARHASDYGLPVPNNCTLLSCDGSGLRVDRTYQSPSDIPLLVEFYRRELIAHGRGYQLRDIKVEATHAKLNFDGPNGHLAITMDRKKNQTELTLLNRSPRDAEIEGLLPKPGGAKLVLSNERAQPVVFKINGVSHSVARQTEKGVILELPKDKYVLRLELPGQPPAERSFDLGQDETWEGTAVESGIRAWHLY